MKRAAVHLGAASESEGKRTGGGGGGGVWQQSGDERKVTGRFSAVEKKALREAIDEYCVRAAISLDALFARRGSTRSSSAWVSIATTALPGRSVESCYNYAMTHWNPRWQRTGAWDAQETETMRAFIATEGKQFGKLADILGRPPRQIVDHYREVFSKASRSKGRWTASEEELLAEAVRTHTQATGEVKWTKVADMVPGRNPTQCRNHWMRAVMSRHVGSSSSSAGASSSGGAGASGGAGSVAGAGGAGFGGDDVATRPAADRRALLQRIMEQAPEDESEIDWSALGLGLPAKLAHAEFRRMYQEALSDEGGSALASSPSFGDVLDALCSMHGV